MIAPYGSWTSPLTASRVTAGALRLGDIALNGGDVYWVEGRAAEAGRNVLVRRTLDGTVSDVTPPGFSVRSRVHEYGGPAFVVSDGAIYFVNYADQRLHAQAEGQAPAPITAEGFYFADLKLDAARGRLIAMREDHTRPGVEPTNAIVSIEIVPGPGVPRPGVILASGADFYAHPVISPDGTALAWLQWNHPNMPWDGTELWTAAFGADGSLDRATKIAGGAQESIFQPEWSPDGTLYFVSDRTGWWNLRRTSVGAAGDGTTQAIEAVHPMEAEFGKPLWTLSMVTYAFAGPTRLVASYAHHGRWALATIDTTTLAFTPVPLPLDPLEALRVDDRAAYFIGASPTTAPAIVRVPFDTRIPEVLRPSSTEAFDPAWISKPEPVTFTAPVPHPSRPRSVHAFYYRPCNPAFEAPAGTRPPLLVLSHGGPTASTDAALDLEIQFWTSRGFAVLDVNYSGSTGYGRAYRERLNLRWGIVDVEDVVAGALALVTEGKADPDRLAIRGGSAGGYTTLAALTFHDVFRAGASYYGISDIEILARDTHKFESRYMDSLVGPYPAAKADYIARSPIHFTSRLSSALILFQGLEDKVVPPNQSEMMAAAVRQKGLPVALITYPGEQHGFRQARNIVRSLEAELYFYGRVFGFEPADAIEPVAIDNLR